MKTRTKLVIGILLAASVGGAVWSFWCRRPVSLVQGKSARYWISVLGDPSVDPSATWTALGPDAVSFFARALRRRDGPGREAYRRLWPRLPAAVQTHLTPPVDGRVVRRGAAWGFFRWTASGHASQWKEADSSVIPFLVSALNDEDKQVRSLIAGALQGAGVAHPEAGDAVVSALIERLQTDQDASVRHFAATSLGFQGESARAAVPTLLVALRNDSSHDVRFWAAGALERIDPEVADKAGAGALKVQTFVEWLQRPDPLMRVVAVRSLGKLGKLAEPAVAVLVAALDDKDGEVRREAAMALKAIDSEAAAKAGVK